MWVWKPSGDAFIGPLIWPAYCWGHEAEFFHTQLSRRSCFSVENSLDIISHYKMRLVSSETHRTEENKTWEKRLGGGGGRGHGRLPGGVKAELALCMQGKGREWRCRQP